MKNRHRGFSLMELLVVVCIIGILAGIAIPQYGDMVARGRRALAKSVLQEQAQFMERYYTQNGRYTSDAAGTTMVTLNPSAEATDFYTFSFDTGATDAQKFLLKAVPINAQANDRCGTLTLTNTGMKNITGGASGVTSDQCW